MPVNLMAATYAQNNTSHDPKELSRIKSSELFQAIYNRDDDDKSLPSAWSEDER